MRRRERINVNLVLSICLAVLSAACVITAFAKQAEPAAKPALLRSTQSVEELPQAPSLTLEELRAVSFADVEDGPQADCIRYEAYLGIMGGAGPDSFQPESLVTRSAVTAALFRMSGEEAPAYTGIYQDVGAEDWYAGAVAWADQAELFGDARTGAFGPREPVTRAQLAALLVRHAEYMAAREETGQTLEHPQEADRTQDAALSLERYRDGGSVPEEDIPYIAKALESGLFRGMVSHTIYPQLPVNRGQLAQCLVALTALETGEPLAAELAGQLQTKSVVSAAAANHGAMQAKVEEIAAKYGAAGLQAAVIEQGEVTDSFACGWATRGTAPMTADHKLRVASLSKVSVGMAAMVLRDQGVIDLDAGIGDYWGFSTRNTRYPNAPVSIRALLSHTSSIPLYGDDVSRSKSAVEAKLRNNQYNSLQPGSVWSWGYNNYGFAVLGMTLELAAGDYLDHVLEESLWDYMEIDAAFEGGEIQALDKLVTIYRHDGSVGRSIESQRTCRRPSAPGGAGTYFAGGLTISANDTAKLLGLLANDGAYQGLRLLSAESVELMETRFDQILPDGTYQALPLRSQDNIYGRDRLYYHTGSAYGVYNFMSYDPETGDGIVVLTTGASASKDSNGIYAVCGEIARYFYALTADPSQTEAAVSAG